MCQLSVLSLTLPSRSRGQMDKEHESKSNAGSAEQPVPLASFAVAHERQGNESSAEKPATSPQCDSHMTISSLAHIFAQRSEETQVKKLLSDVATLRAWQTEEHASHKIRDAMTKLGSEWNVPQKAARKKRPPSEIAADLEREILAFAERLWHKKTPFFSSMESAVKPLPDNTLLEITKRRRKDSDTSTDL